MKIQIASGIGRGLTELAAFDAALVAAGTANFNLIYLSSIIPPGCEIKELDQPAKLDGEWGDRLYVVMAAKRTALHNDEAWAGIGWVQDPKTKKGMLVEHYGSNEAKVKSDITDSLNGLIANREGNFGPVGMKVMGIKCDDKPVCALVVAIFENSTWKHNKQSLKHFSVLGKKFHHI